MKDSSNMDALKKAAIIFLILFLKNDLIMGQITDTSSNIKELDIKMAPTQLLLGEVKFSGEKFLNRKNSIEVSGTYVLNVSLSEYIYPGYEENFVKRAGFKVSLGHRYYYPVKSKLWYLNPIVSYTYLDYRETELTSMTGFHTFGGAEETSNYRYWYNFFKTAYSLQLNYGTKYLFKTGFFFDAYIGIGVRYRLINVTDHFPKGVVMWESPIDDFNTFLPTLHLGFTIGYKLNTL